jgi:hypothetical protein
MRFILALTTLLLSCQAGSPLLTGSAPTSPTEPRPPGAVPASADAAPDGLRHVYLTAEGGALTLPY